MSCWWTDIQPRCRLEKWIGCSPPSNRHCLLIVKGILEKLRDNVCELVVDWTQSEAQKQMPYLFTLRVNRSSFPHKSISENYKHTYVEEEIKIMTLKSQRYVKTRVLNRSLGVQLMYLVDLEVVTILYILCYKDSSCTFEIKSFISACDYTHCNPCDYCMTQVQ
jgi:hypothetical protein